MPPAPPTLPGIIDSHAHLDMEPLAGDRDGVLERARQAGLSQILTIGTGMAESREAITIAEQASTDDLAVWATVGVHPHDAVTMTPGDLAALAGLARAPRVVAIGEIGLDYHYDHSPREVQQARFRDQMALAREVGRPVVIHSREAEADTARILAEFPGVSGVLHCFSSHPDLAQQALKLGYAVSFSGIVTFRNAEAVQRAAAEVPLERMLVETDCPFLAPMPYRGKPNEPAYVTRVAEVIGEIKRVTAAHVAAVTAANTRKLFGLPS